jgi:hypothetical protein
MKETRNIKNSIYTRKIKPRRYVWHVSLANPLLISRKGLLTSSDRRLGYENAVFAHNAKVGDDGPGSQSWFPLMMDWWHWDKSVGFVDCDLEEAYWLQSYDFWRIDTTIYKGDWFVDTIAQNDFCGIVWAANHRNLFIVTFDNIPPEALTHYKYHIDERIIYTDSGTYTEGRFRPAAHVTEEKWWWYLLRDDLPV